MFRGSFSPCFHKNPLRQDLSYALNTHEGLRGGPRQNFPAGKARIEERPGPHPAHVTDGYEVEQFSLYPALHARYQCLEEWNVAAGEQLRQFLHGVREPFTQLHPAPYVPRAYSVLFRDGVLALFFHPVLDHGGGLDLRQEEVELVGIGGR